MVLGTKPILLRTLRHSHQFFESLSTWKKNKSFYTERKHHFLTLHLYPLTSRYSPLLTVSSLLFCPNRSKTDWTTRDLRPSSSWRKIRCRGDKSDCTGGTAGAGTRLASIGGLYERPLYEDTLKNISLNTEKTRVECVKQNWLGENFSLPCGCVSEGHLRCSFLFLEKCPPLLHQSLSLSLQCTSIQLENYIS